MLSIDEAIAHAREVADTCEYEANKYDMSDSYESHVAYQEGKCAEEHEQLAEWLEELKALREEKSEFLIYAKDIAEANYEMGMESGYNKALDDFVHECDKYCEFYSGKSKNLTREDILKIAEQLKEQK